METKKVSVVNISNRKQAIAGVPAFEPKETREVTVDVAEKLLSNPNFQIKTKKVEKAEVQVESEVSVETKPTNKKYNK